MDSVAKPAPPILWWLKKDFRLRDNPCLRRALNTKSRVVALWIVEPSMLAHPESSLRHLRVQLDAALGLDATLRQHGGQLCIALGEVIPVLQRVRELEAWTHMISHQEVGTRASFDRDLAVQRWVKSSGLRWFEYRQTGVFRRLDCRNRRHLYWRSFYAEPLAKAPSRTELATVRPSPALRALVAPMAAKLRELVAKVPRCEIIDHRSAEQTLDSFLDARAKSYGRAISCPQASRLFGSRLSTHLAWGTISPRVVLGALASRRQELQGRWERSLSMFESRMHWRDHFIQRLECAPDLATTALCPSLDALFVPGRRQDLAAFEAGRTGFPLVDACIRCAKQTGFLNFRMRAMITSTACHLLRIPWQEVGLVMARWWIDYEPGIHWAQVQMQSGVVGINQNRIYNPHTQLQKLDPQAQFVRRFVSELRQHSPQAIVAHAQQPLPGYPAPLVQVARARQRFLALNRQIRADPQTRARIQEVLLKHGSRADPMRNRSMRGTVAPIDTAS